MSIDWRQKSWERDIERFAELKRLFYKLTIPTNKGRVQVWMKEIQQKWPQFIKPEEIPY